MLQTLPCWSTVNIGKLMLSMLMVSPTCPRDRTELNWTVFRLRHGDFRSAAGCVARTAAMALSRADAFDARSRQPGRSTEH